MLEEDYHNFFKMLKFWIKQTDHNINKTNKIRFKEIDEGNAEEAEKKFNNPKFISNYLYYSHFSIRISFFRTDQYKGEKVNFVVFRPDNQNQSSFINIIYNYNNQKIIASYRSDNNKDTTSFKDYMYKLGFQEGKSFNVKELELESEEPNSQVKSLFDYFSKMIEKGKEYNVSKNMQVNELREILKQSYNMILRGAPGTGKTFLAQQIAALIISDGRTADIEELTDAESKQLGFVQFHPSYDYTDFVEGLRPTSSGNEVGFELESGIFKNFCERAGEKVSKTDAKSIEDIWSEFIESLGDEKVEINNYKFVANGRGNVTYYVPGGSTGSLTLGRIKYYIHNGNWGGKNYHSTYKTPIFEKYIKPKLKDVTLIDNTKPYVFIIDEINRGEISKIFGELFFSLDPGYRGPKGGVLTQYSNLHDDKDEKFFIPKNVYIIGTMNDIDRSVDTFDFAMRRRFTFVEVTAEQSANNMLTSDDTRDLMSRLNKALVDKSKGGLTRDYMIGASYFLSIDGKGTAQEVIQPLWNNKLQPLLIEYFRGEHEADRKIKLLENAYFAAQEES